jgi:hypothetical protein
MRMRNKRRHKSVSGLSEEDLNELGRRLCAAYASYFAGYKGADHLLREAEYVGTFGKSSPNSCGSQSVKAGREISG